MLTWALGLLDIKYHLDGSVAFESGFPGDVSAWQRAGDWSNIDIEDDRISVTRETDNRSFAKRSFPLPVGEYPSSSKLRIRGTLETLGITETPADSDGRGAAYMVWLQDADDEVKRYLTIQDLTGERERYEAERIVSIPDDVAAFTLVLNSRDSGNSFSLTNASVDLISITPIYKAGILLLVIAWLAIFAMGAIWIYKRGSRTLFITSSLLITGIIVGVMLPETATVGVVDPAFKTISHLIPAFDLEAAHSTYKIGHFLFFLLISLVLGWHARSLPASGVILVLLLFLLAIASEGMQLHLFNRTTRLSDLGIDGAGILLGWLLATTAVRMSRN
ncbi:VanZ family protein [Granulosicoccus sp. 3-233]